ncbi:MAG: hypothetical protein MK101_03215 [Phycisphaerales bacterium]|nr:hypothetical protein [Phycisphaerales bacterium]
MQLSTRITLTSALLTLVVAASGCTSYSGLVGSWQGDGSASEQPFTFGAVAFEDDGTFSAEARYGNVIRVQTGHWKIDGERVVFIEDDRSYTYHIMGDTVEFTDPRTGNSMVLVRSH